MKAIIILLSAKAGSFMTDDGMKTKSASTTEVDVNPKINRFVLYAERSIKLGNYSHALEGDVGVGARLRRQPRRKTPAPQPN
jgi:hypothetical protein